jgi:hypothetical protein
MTTALNKTISRTEYKNYLEKSVSYDEYKKAMAADLLANTDPKIKEYILLNQHRMNRVEKTYSVSNGLEAQVKNLQHKTYWLVLTEHWCGDASQTLPVFDYLSRLSGGNIELKLLYRDENPELMEAYLTNGTKSIPKLIQLDAQMNVTGVWGPRPAEAQALVKLLKSNPATAANYSTELHLWYAKNKQQALNAELLELVGRADLLCTDCLS